MACFDAMFGCVWCVVSPYLWSELLMGNSSWVGSPQSRTGVLRGVKRFLAVL